MIECEIADELARRELVLALKITTDEVIVNAIRQAIVPRYLRVLWRQTDDAQIELQTVTAIGYVRNQLNRMSDCYAEAFELVRRTRDDLELNGWPDTLPVWVRGLVLQYWPNQI